METIFEMFSYPFMVRAFAVGALVALCSALLGVSLVLKRYSMIGDGLSHVGFGALAIAASLNMAPLAVAIPVVILAAVLLLRIRGNSRIKGDAAIALISTSSLAVGVMVISMTTGMNTDVYNYNDFPIIIEGGSEYSDEVIWENIRFEGQGYAGGQNDWVTIIKLEGGRPKYNCTKGFGICHAWIFGWQAWNQVPVDDYSISIGIDDVVNVAELETVTLELAEMPSIDLTNVWLPVEEEIVVLVDEAEFDPIDKLVPIQQCVFDPSIGEYGGFELQLEDF